ncbi:IclR family transcriptional regulator [Sphaerisporangium flaviroseum]|uniref:IclR family transcriptional regulator n=1 Tax=Sphaerisporangium flaviroseum TaxID=509199 RepID=A0ABP7I9Y6_9ACTN
MQSVVTTLRVLDVVATRQPVGVSELAREMDLPKSTVQRALQALASAGWIRPAGAETTRWVLTTKPLGLAMRVDADTGVREAALPVMAELRDRTGESVHLAIREGREIVIIERMEATRPVRIHWPAGTRSACHATANGKAILAYLGPLELAEALGSPLPGYTEATITNRDTLEAELATVRARGYALAKRELRDDIFSVAAPIMSAGQVPVASLSVFLPLHRLPEDGGAELGELVMQSTRQISRSFGAG